MRLSDIYGMLSGIEGFSGKVGYREFPKNDPQNPPPSVPFIVYYVDYDNNFPADNIVYLPIKHIRIELVTRQKDETAEALVEAALTANELVYSSDDDTLDNERCHITTYEIEI